MNPSSFLNTPWKVLSLLMLAAFGPYLSISTGFQSIHAVLYPLFLCFYLSFCLHPKKILLPHFVFMTFWLLILLWMTLSTFFSFGEDPTRSLTLCISRFENILQPFCIFFVVSQLVLLQGEEKRLLRQLIWFFVGLLSLNALWSLIGKFIPTFTVNQWFWGGENSVAFRAQINSRYLGIINQPVESGILYSIGLLCWAYVTRNLERKLHFFLSLPLLALLLLGGVLSASKVFVGGGLLFSFYLIFYHRVFFMAGIASLGIFLACFQEALRNHFQYISNKLVFSDFHSFWQQYLELRYSKTSGNREMIDSILEQSPFCGFGFGAFQTVDSGYTEMLAQGGIVCLLIYLGLLFSMGIHSLLLMKQNETRPEGLFLLLLTGLVVGSSLGGPVFTANRVSVILCLILGLLLRTKK